MPICTAPNVNRNAEQRFVQVRLMFCKQLKTAVDAFSPAKALPQQRRDPRRLSQLPLMLARKGESLAITNSSGN